MLTASVSAKTGDQSQRSEDFRRVVDEFRRVAKTFEMQTRGLDLPHVGTILNEIGVPEAACASLAFLLGKEQTFRRLSKVDVPKIPAKPSDVELNEIAATLILLHNRALTAEAVAAESRPNQVERWNLDCVGRHGIAANQRVMQTSRKARFDVRENQLHVLGDIESGFYERFAQELAKHPQIKYVVLGSGGGSVRDAILAGLLIRRLRLETMLSSDCYSACPLIFLGGVQRTIWSPYPRLGFHQVSSGGVAVQFDHEIYKMIKSYATSMGANGAVVIGLMLKSPPNQMNYPEVFNLCDPGITTWVQRAC